MHLQVNTRDQPWADPLFEHSYAFGLHNTLQQPDSWVHEAQCEIYLCACFKYTVVCSFSACSPLPMGQHQAIGPQVQVPCINWAVQRCALVPVNIQSSGHWTLSRGVTLKRKSWTRKALLQRFLPYCTVSEFVLSEVLGHAVCLLTRKLMYCQAEIPCQFESTSLTFIFLRSHLSCYQLGSNLVDQ